MVVAEESVGTAAEESVGTAAEESVGTALEERSLVVGVSVRGAGTCFCCTGEELVCPISCELRSAIAN